MKACHLHCRHLPRSRARYSTSFHSVVLISGTLWRLNTSGALLHPAPYHIKAACMHASIHAHAPAHASEGRGAGLLSFTHRLLWQLVHVTADRGLLHSEVNKIWTLEFYDQSSLHFAS